jgi:predicted nucleotidyltransferase
MRLSSKEVMAILTTLEKHLSISASAQVYLFGSRVFDHLSGGDIDLAIIVESSEVREKLVEKDFKILADLKSNPEIGDQKIDLKILTSVDAASPFFQKALSHAILLN